jgi:hypothetical protein|tara:strand:- start:376 stop:540 length:165 start_codon:yes stop_codon:yes gene_type:complete
MAIIFPGYGVAKEMRYFLIHKLEYTAINKLSPVNSLFLAEKKFSSSPLIDPTRQ